MTSEAIRKIADDAARTLAHRRSLEQQARIKCCNDLASADTELLNWLQARGVDYIALNDGGCIDVKNFNNDLRGAIAGARKDES